MKANPQLQQLIEKLRSTSAKEGVGIWKRVAADLNSGSSSRRVVNLSRLSRATKENELVVVPGKVLAGGEITQPVQVAAYSFSKGAAAKIVSAKGKVMTIAELIEKNPKGKEVRIIG